MIGGEFRPPVDIDIAGIDLPALSLGADKYQLFFEQPLDGQAGRVCGRYMIAMSSKPSAIRRMSPLGHFDFGAQGDVGRLALHPDEPPHQKWVPQIQLGTYGDDHPPAFRYCNLVLRALPDLNKGRCIVEKLLARRRKGRPRLVSSE